MSTKCQCGKCIWCRPPSPIKGFIERRKESSMNNHATEGPLTWFRIFVEDVGDREQLVDMVSDVLLSAHVSYGRGVWQGGRENDAVVEVYGPERLRGTVVTLATELKAAFQQEAVGVAEHNDRVNFYLV